MTDKQSKEETAKAVPLAIVGIGCLFPKANDAKSYWTNIRDGVDAITEIPDTHWKPEDYFDDDKNAPDMTYARRGGFIDPVDFDPLLYGLSPNNIEATDTTQLLGMVVARQALLDAGYATGKDSNDGRPFDRDRTSVILGVTGTLELVIPLGARLGHPIWRQALADAGIDKQTAEEVVQRIAEGYVPWQENSFPGLLGNVAAGRIANRFDLGGTNCVVDAACASSLSAVHMAALELYSGRADMAITGGFDTFNDIFMYMCFSKTPALSPTGNSRPFDHDGDGTILGEGLGAVILKRLDDAERDGDQIYAVLKGIGSSSDGKGNAIYAPSANGQTKALKNAYREAGVSPRTIELVEAHGTGTKVGDAVEATALSSVYREDQAEGSWCAIGSVKSMIGHTKAAAGVAGLIKVALALQHKVLPPTIKVDSPLDLLEPGEAPVYVNTRKRPWLGHPDHPRRAALSAFGFGGSNFHCVLEEAEKTKTDIEWDGQVLLFTLSGDSLAELQTQVKAINPAQAWASLRAQAAQSLANFDSAHASRLVLVVTPETKLEKLLDGVQGMLVKGETSWSTPDGAYFGSGNAEGEVAMLFPGQGSQYCGMLVDLACQFPHLQAALTELDAVVVGGEPRLSDIIYPIPVFSEPARQEDEERLRATQHAQPAIGASSLGAFNILQHFSVQADATSGHSFGELTALYAAKRIDEEALYKLAMKRGELMQGDGGDRGSMLAVSASAAVVHEFLEAGPLDVIIANNNAPKQVVLSGATEQIEKAEQQFEKRGFKTRRLPVAAAFHSSYVADAEKPFVEFLNDIEFQQTGLPVYANSTAAVYPDDVTKAKALLGGQLARPVEFVPQIENMYADGIRTFIEVGPGNTLTGLVKSILAEKEHHAIALDASRGRRSGQFDLACLLAQLSVLGHQVDLPAWDAGYLDDYVDPAGQKPAMTVTVTGANYVKPRTKREPSPAKNLSPSGKPQVSQQTVPMKNSSQVTMTNSKSASSDLLQATQQNILALQKMQEQTANLHKQYLLGQEAAQQSIQQLIQQQQQLLTGAPLTTSSLPVAAPTPTVAEPQVVNNEPPAAAVVAATVKPVVNNDHYEQLLLEVVADKTGYPVEMLSMDMSLDTDLGIDSIKRVEILSALQEKLPSVTRVQPEDLGTFQLLKHIVEFLASDVSVETTPAAHAQATTTPVQDTRLQTVLLEVVADKTGYPVDMLNLDMNLDTDLGIDSIKRVEILSAFQERMPEAPLVNPEDLATLQTLQQIVDFMQSGVQSTPAAPPAAAVSADTGKLQQILLEVVAEKTGYPEEMLNLDMNLDTDLGIDSIKRVEILSAFQEKMPEAPTVNPEDLATLQTLQQIVDFMQGQVVTTPTESTAVGNIDKLQSVLLEVVADKTGYPVEMLNLDMNLDTDLGIDSIKRVEILSAFQEQMPDAPAVNPEDLAALQTLQQIVDHMQSGVAAPAKTAGPQVQQEVRQEPALYRGVVELKDLTNVNRKSIGLSENDLVWVTDDGTDLAQKIVTALEKQNLQAKVVAVDTELKEDVAALILLAPAKAGSEFLQSAFQLIQHMAAPLRRSGKVSLLASVSRLGGAFGIADLSTANPVTGGVAGLVKTADKEWPEVQCKAIDIPANRNSAKLATAIVDELLLEGPLEVGMTDKTRRTLVLSKHALEQSDVGRSPFEKDDVVVITGGARGVTAEIAVAMANTYQTRLLLLGRTPLPGPEPEWLQGIVGEAGIKKAIITHHGAQLLPKEVEQHYQRIQSKREVIATMQSIQAAGVEVRYESLDVRDEAALTKVIADTRKDLGPVAGIIHGAGVLADRLIEDKTVEQFQQVYSTKVEGLNALIKATEKDALKVMVMFSSSTGRYGRKGQVDYAVANEVLNKIAQQQQTRRADCRVVSINWGPWDGGMVTPQLKKLFESEGVGVIPLQAGAEYLMQEISSKGPVELVLLGSEPEAQESVLVTQQSDENLDLAFQRTLTIEDYPVLKSHVMNGKAVLPAALIAEWLAHGAIHNNPGLSFIGFDDLSVLKGVILEAGESLDLRIMAGHANTTGDEDKVSVELRSGNVLHARASIVLSTSYPKATAVEPNTIKGDYPFKKQEFYSNGQLFHGADLHAIEHVDACSEAGIVAQVNSALAPAKWMSQPVRSSWLSDPLILDGAFQLMILWSFQQSGVGSLPTKVGRYRQFHRRFPKTGVKLVICIESSSKHASIANIDFIDDKEQLIARIEGYECVIDASLNDAFIRNELELQV